MSSDNLPLLADAEPIDTRVEVEDGGDVEARKSIDEFSIEEEEEEEYGLGRAKQRRGAWWILVRVSSAVVIALLMLLLAWITVWRVTEGEMVRMEPSPFWAAEIEEDRRTQEVLKAEFDRRRVNHKAALDSAKANKKKKNNRSPEDGKPLIVYWPSPPYFWDRYFGKGQGEVLDVEDCEVSCKLVSGFRHDPGQSKSHMLVRYNAKRGDIDGLEDADGRHLQPYQKSVLYTMEVGAFDATNQPQLKFFDILASFSQFSEIRFETYSRRLESGYRLLGIAQVDTKELADELWGPNRDELPSRKALEGLDIPPALRSGTRRIATFISNCHAIPRRKLIEGLMAEGIEFDHYGKCNETFFGGSPPPYSLSFSKGITHSSQMTKMAVLSLYPFTLVLENTILSDYQTEKVTEGLLGGGIPIILGAPNLEDDLQPPGSQPLYIDALKYTPKELADIIKTAKVDDDERQKYHSWVKRLPGWSRVLEWTTRQMGHDFTEFGSNLKRPICDMCRYYHQIYDWEEDAPVEF